MLTSCDCWNIKISELRYIFIEFFLKEVDLSIEIDADEEEDKYEDGGI